jgi:hypothetical protein
MRQWIVGHDQDAHQPPARWCMIVLGGSESLEGDGDFWVVRAS